jgi:uncharacterized membrane protein
MDSNIVYAVLLGLSLAASTGLNTFLPLLMLAGAAHFKVLDAENILNGSFAWIASGGALTALALAATVEIIGDKIPAVDHLLDGFGTLARPIVGTFAAASVFTNADPAMAALAGLVIGAPTALGFHAAKAGTRATSSATTLGVANPVLSTLEDIVAVLFPIVGLVAPLLVPVILILVIYVMWRLFKSARARWPLSRRRSLAT